MKYIAQQLPFSTQNNDVRVLMALQGGKTVLHYSSESGNAELVKMLLGVDGIHDVNLADKVGHA